MYDHRESNHTLLVSDLGWFRNSHNLRWHALFLKGIEFKNKSQTGHFRCLAPWSHEARTYCMFPFHTCPISIPDQFHRKTLEGRSESCVWHDFPPVPNGYVWKTFDLDTAIDTPLDTTLSTSQPMKGNKNIPPDRKPFP